MFHSRTLLIRDRFPFCHSIVGSFFGANEFTTINVFTVFIQYIHQQYWRHKLALFTTGDLSFFFLVYAWACVAYITLFLKYRRQLLFSILWTISIIINILAHNP